MKTYSELLTFKTLEDRYEYLKLNGSIGKDTFGYLRYLCQDFYNSQEWRSFREKIIIRDNDGCEMGLKDYPIQGRIILHHITPITIDDILDRNLNALMNPDNLICVSHDVHNAIHYGNKNLLPQGIVERFHNDMCPWR